MEEQSLASRLGAMEQLLEQVTDTLSQLAVDQLQREWMSQREAEEYLGLGRHSLLRYRNRGELVYSQPGKKIMYRRGDLDAFLERHSTR